MEKVIKSLAFWKGISFIAAGALILLSWRGVVPSQYAFPAEAILAAILSLLQFIGVKPELRARGIL